MGVKRENVVYLARTESGRGAAMPYRIEQLRRTTETRLVFGLRRTLARAQEALAQVAQHGGDSAVQCRAAEQQVRLHRHDMEEVLRAGLEYRFAALIDPGAVPVPPLLPTDRDEARMVEALCTAGQAQSEQIAAALTRELRGRPVTAENNPLSPECLADLMLRVERRPHLEPPARRLVVEVIAQEIGSLVPGLHSEGMAHLSEEWTAKGGTAAVKGGESADGRAELALLPRSPEPVAEAVERAERSYDRVERARQRVQQEVARCLDGRQPPELVERLVRDAWARLLLMVHVTEGPDSETWVRNCAVMERLLWSFSRLKDDAARRRLVLEIPLLLHEITDGLQTVLHDPFELSKLLRALEHEYLRNLTQNDPELERISANDAACERSQQADIDRLAHLPQGTWMEVEGHDGDRLRVRLARRTEQGDLQFTNRAGFMVLERSAEALAEAMAMGRAEVLDDYRLFNEGLSRVVRRLTDRRLGHGE